MASKGALVVRFIGDTRDFERATKRTTGVLGKVGRLAGAAIVGGGLVSFLKSANAEAREAQKVGALTAQVIKTTGGAAKVSAEHVGALSEAISKKAGIDDEAIQSGANLLLTFKKIRNEAGEGNKVFDRATRAAVNLSAAGFGDLTATSKQLGKALNDPLKGISALGRAGVTFTEKQKEQIKTLVETGDVLKAQKIILREVESQVGGAAKAQATAADHAKVAWENLQEQIGTGLLPVVDKAANLFADEVAPAISKFVSGMQDGTGAGGEFVDVLEDARDVGKDVLSFFNSIPEPVKKFGAQALIAAFALRKLSAMSTAFGSAMASPIARTKQFHAELTYAETRMQKVSTASRAMGGALRNAAGIGGMLLMAKSAGKADSAVGALGVTAGAALTGFAAGGPIGAAVGAGAGGIFALYKSLNKAKDELKVSLPSYKEYAATLDGVAAATSKATREMVYQRLEQSGLLAATRELGLTDREAVAAMMGNAAQRKNLSNLLRNQNTLTKEQESALRKETGAVGASRLAQLQKNVALAENREELRKARKALRDFMDEPASKRVSITGVEDAKAQLNSLKTAIRQVWGVAKDANVAGAGGLNVLLNPKPGKNASGTQSWRGGWTEVGEHGRELVRLPGGSRIFPAGQSAQMMSGSAGGSAGGGHFGTLTVIVKTDSGKVIEQKLVSLKRDKGGRPLEFL